MGSADGKGIYDKRHFRALLAKSCHKKQENERVLIMTK